MKESFHPVAAKTAWIINLLLMPLWAVGATGHLLPGSGSIISFHSDSLSETELFCDFYSMRVVSENVRCPGQSFTLRAILTVEDEGNYTPEIEFTWNGPGGTKTGNPVTFFTPGLYTVTMVSECQKLDGRVSVTLPDVEDRVAVVASSPVCEGGNIILSATSLPGYDYEWTGPNDFRSTLLSATVTRDARLDQSGIYTLQTTSPEGCEGPSNEVEVIVNPRPEAFPADLVVCQNQPGESVYNLSTADTLVNPSGLGTVVWFSDPTDPNAIITNPWQFTTLDDEVYAEVQSDAGCISERVVVSLDTTLGVNAAIEILKEPTCNEPDGGVLLIVVEQGIPPFDYQWNLDFWNGNPNPENLSPGLYEVTISGANGCNQVQEVELLPPPVFDVQCALLEPVSKVGEATGQVSLMYTGVLGNSTLSWSGPVSGSRAAHPGGLDTLGGLPAGLYLITITDAGGCFASCEILVPEPDCANFSVGFEWRDPLCAGEASGQIFLFPSTETVPFDIDWNVDEWDGSLNPNNLPGGSYSVTITDVLGCRDSLEIMLTDPQEMILDCAVLQPAVSPFSSDGVVEFNLAGGVGSRVFTIDGPLSLVDTFSMDTTLVVAGLPVGEYQARMVDFNGCSDNCNFIIPSASCDSLSVVLLTEPISCAGENAGKIMAVATGGEAPYGYFWTSDGFQLTGDTLSGLPSGTYSLTLTDAQGCRLTETVVLDAPIPLTLSCALQQGTTGVERTDGVVQWSADGGQLPYRIEWTGSSNGSRTITDNGIGFIEGLPAGLLIVVVTDANGCAQTCEVLVPGPDCSDLLVRLEAEDESCSGGADGVLSVFVDGGEGPYTYSWANPELKGPNPGGLAAGIYPVTVTDTRGCSISEEGTIGLLYPLPDATMGTGGAICLPNCAVLPVGFSGEAPFRLTYRIIGPDGMVLAEELSSESEESFISICPTDLGYSSGNLSVVLDEVNDAFCSSDIFGESLITIMEPKVHQVDTTLCLTDSILVNGSVYDRNNPFGTEIIPSGATNGCDSVIEVTLRFFSQPEIANLQTICDFTDGSFRIVFDISGRPPFRVAGLTGQINAGRFTSDPIMEDGLHSFIVFDERDCAREFQVASPDCSREGNCPVSVASILDIQTEGCAADTIRLTLSQTGRIPEGYGQEIVIHDGTSTQLGSILIRSSSSALVFREPLQLGSNYHLAVIAGRLLNEEVDEADPCLDVFLGPSISFRGGPITPAFIQGQDTLCAGAELLLFAEDIPGVSYVWTLPSGKKDTTDNRLLRIPGVGPEDAGAYYVQTINGDCPSMPFGPQYFSILDAPIVDAGTDQLVCGPDGVVLEALDPAPASGSWSSVVEEPLIFQADSFRTVIDNVQPGANVFIWTVRGTPCGQADTVTVFYQRDPILEDDTWRLNETSNRITFDAFRNDDLEGYPLNDSSVFVVAQPEAGLVQYFPEEKVFEFTYELSGLAEVLFEYAVCAQACGTCDTASVLIVLPDVFLIVPEGITPNDDGRNDFLRIENIEAYPDNEVLIVNRWGQPVYQKKNYSNLDPWDGSFEGRPLPQGAYYLVVRVEGKETVVRKTIHLINRSNP